ncbi:MAG: alanine racemase [Ruminiclostridium sp.]|nr:alanine racemase [Ruminiclostridium sp.]
MKKGRVKPLNTGQNRTWAEINLDHIGHNVREIAKRVGKMTEMMAVVKADAYGHGIFETVPTLLESGASRLAVSMLDEAIQLRDIGVKVPILVLSYTDPVRAEEIIEYGITQTVFSHDLAQALSKAAVKLGKQARIHIKIDTGMTRVGFSPGYSAIKDVVEINQLPGIIIEGLFSHFASADEAEREYTLLQYEMFESIVQELNRIGILIPVKHISNSGGILQYPTLDLDMVRPGIILYGLYPSDEVDKTVIELKPAMSLKAKVVMVREVEPGVPVSYGRTYTTKRKSRIATIPIGYADGYSRLLSNTGRVLIHGEYAPVLGRVCMDQCMVDVTDIPTPVKTGDEVVLFGKQGNREITVEEVAALSQTVNYEVVCLIGKRVPRVYLKEGKVVNVINYLHGTAAFNTTH